jgi:sugar transferase (PEP-CTERM/EpsH1 system associated)
MLPAANPGIERTPASCRVALVVSHLKGGGKEECVVNLANSLAADGWKPLVVCLEVVGRLESKIRPGVEIVALHKRRGHDVGVVCRLARLLRERRIDVVHCHNWGTAVESVAAAAIAGVRTVVHTQHGLDYGFGPLPPRWRRLARRLAMRAVARRLTRIVVVSREVEETVEHEWRVPREKVRLIHNGIALGQPAVDRAHRAAMRRALALDDDDILIGSVGAFRPVKDFPMLVEAMAEVHREAPRARLVLIGSGPTLANVREAVERLGLHRAVVLPGWRSDVPDLLRAMDVFALSSISEGVSLAILEAMAAGLPVVATRVGGNPEIVHDSETGLLVPPGSPKAMAGALIALACDAEKRRAMGRRAREHVERSFSLSRMARDYEALYAAAGQ